YRPPSYLLFSSLCSLTARSPTAISTLSLHDALPICWSVRRAAGCPAPAPATAPAARAASCRRTSPRRVAHHPVAGATGWCRHARSEEHTSELQSRENLVCRLLLEKKNKKDKKSRRHI